MIERFVDTGGWAELADRSLPFHAQAKAGVEEVWEQAGRLVTTTFVLAELTALLTSPLRWPKPQQIQYLEDIRQDSSTVVVSLSAAQEQEAWLLWSGRSDKKWTFADCASFVVMRQRGLAEALTTDHHFEQAGFVRLLK
jgi:predicted nucleic acid-binding protein